jgi:hypothetical protein
MRLVQTLIYDPRTRLGRVLWEMRTFDIVLIPRPTKCGSDPLGIGRTIVNRVRACSITTTYAIQCFPSIGDELVVVHASCSFCINSATSYSVQPFIAKVVDGNSFPFFIMCVIFSMIAAILMVMCG